MRLVQESRHINKYKRSKPGRKYTTRNVEVKAHDKKVNIKKLTNAEKKAIMDSRTKRAVSQDIRRRGKIPVNDTTWAGKPGRYDMEGIDTPLGAEQGGKKDSEIYKKDGVEIIATADQITVKGDTFRYKKDLKQEGYKWNPESKTWTKEFPSEVDKKYMHFDLKHAKETYSHYEVGERYGSGWELSNQERCKGPV